MFIATFRSLVSKLLLINAKLVTLLKNKLGNFVFCSQYYIFIYVKMLLNFLAEMILKDQYYLEH